MARKTMARDESDGNLIAHRLPVLRLLKEQPVSEWREREEERALSAVLVGSCSATAIAAAGRRRTPPPSPGQTVQNQSNLLQ